MCGFVGIWNSSEFKEGNHNETLKKMLDTINHRGPDDFGVWNQDSKRDLGIVDYLYKIFHLPGHQPMISSSGRFPSYLMVKFIIILK